MLACTLKTKPEKSELIGRICPFLSCQEAGPAIIERIDSSKSRTRKFDEAIDSAGADLAVHGHGHLGTEVGSTAGGIPVRNVAVHNLQAPYRVYRLALTSDDHESRTRDREHVAYTRGRWEVDAVT